MQGVMLELHPLMLTHVIQTRVSEKVQYHKTALTVGKEQVPRALSTKPSQAKPQFFLNRGFFYFTLDF